LKEIEPNDYNGIAAYGACEANEEYVQIEAGFIEVADESV
jgi:hypothetical protein